MATALITGASSGIGKELARLFAAEGVNVVLVARRKPLLDELSAELEGQFNVKARAIACDLGAAESLNGLLREVATLDLDYLVNNAGFGTVGAFCELDAAREAEMIALNVTALVQLTGAVLPGMLAKKRGGILNIGSTAGFQPGPFMATYYATKAFVNSFSESLAFELKGTGVTVTVSCPGPTRTEFGRVSGVENSRLFTLTVASAESVAREAYNALKRGKPMIVHGFMNWLGVQLLRVAPRSTVRSVTASLNRPASSKQGV